MGEAVREARWKGSVVAVVTRVAGRSAGAASNLSVGLRVRFRARHEGLVRAAPRPGRALAGPNTIIRFDNCLRGE